MPEVLNDSIPILSPALGFRRDLAMVSVAIMERLKGNRLNIQPYLVTAHPRTATFNGRTNHLTQWAEIALKVIPEGSGISDALAAQ